MTRNQLCAHGCYVYKTETVTRVNCFSIWLTVRHQLYLVLMLRDLQTNTTCVMNLPFPYKDHRMTYATASQHT